MGSVRLKAYFIVVTGTAELYRDFGFGKETAGKQPVGLPTGRDPFFDILAVYFQFKALKLNYIAVNFQVTQLSFEGIPVTIILCRD